MQRPESPKLQDIIAKSYPKLHEEGAFNTPSWRRHVPLFDALTGPEERRAVLDYGCGPDGGLSNALYDAVYPYDPYVAKYTTPVQGRKFKAVFSTDVMEHLTVDQIQEYLALVRRVEADFVLTVAATRPSSRTLVNGLNIHLTVQPAQWWYGLFQASLHPDFLPVHVVDDLMRDEVVLAFRRKGTDAN